MSKKSFSLRTFLHLNFYPTKNYVYKQKKILNIKKISYSNNATNRFRARLSSRKQRSYYRRTWISVSDVGKRFLSHEFFALFSYASVGECNRVSSSFCKRHLQEFYIVLQETLPGLSLLLRRDNIYTKKFIAYYFTQELLCIIKYCIYTFII